MSLASETRRAVRDRPFLRAGLRAGVINYAAAADLLDLDGEREAVATALRRYAEELPAFETESRTARVTMRSGVGLVDGEEGGERDGADGTEPLFAVGDAAVHPDAGSETAVLAVGDGGDVDVDALAAVLDRLAAAGVDASAAAVAGGTLLVVVGRREGATALRTVEAALDAVPVGGDAAPADEGR